MNNSQTTPSIESSPVNSAHPPAPIKPKRKKWLKVLLIIVGILLLIPIGIAIFIFITFIYFNNTISSDAKEISAEPVQTDAFLDSRYIDGIRPLKIEGTTGGTFLGLSKDRSKLALHVQNEYDSDRTSSENDLQVIDVKTGKQLMKREYERCSNTTPEDTAYCSRFDKNSTNNTHLLEQINLNTGKIVSTAVVSDSAISKISFLGKHGGNTLLQIRLGASEYDGIVALKNDKDTLWASEITDASILMECGLISKSATILCNSELDVIVLDAKSGEIITRESMNNYPVMASDGWVARDSEKVDTSKGISRDAPVQKGEGIDGAPAGFAVLSYDERGKSDKKGGTIVEVIPTPNYSANGQVTYPRSSLIMKGLSSKYIVDKTGKVILHKKTDGLGSTEEKYVVTATNKKAFSGVPVAVTSDANVVLVANTASTSEDTFRLLDIKNGKTLQTIRLTGISTQLSVSQGIMMNNDGGSSLELYLPGR